jgi:hypothetical protein
MPHPPHLAPGEDRPAGYVFALPPAPIRCNDGKTRRHLLLNRCAAEHWGTLAHMTSQPDRTGGRVYEVRERRGRMALPAQRGSYVLAYRVLPWPAAALGRPLDALGRHLPGVRVCVRGALGIGTGPAPAGSPSLRGRLVRLTPEVSASLAAEVGVVVTEHDCSARRTFEVVVPVVDGAFYEPADGDVVLSDGAPWRAALPWSGDPVALVPLTISLSHGGGLYRGQIGDVLPVSLFPGELACIERALEARFGC